MEKNKCREERSNDVQNRKSEVRMIFLKCKKNKLIKICEISTRVKMRKRIGLIYNEIWRFGLYLQNNITDMRFVD
jgi:hypothetical protein